MTSMGVVKLSGLRGFGFHGVLSEERQNGQTFIVDLAVELDLARVAATDDLAQTVDYSGLAEVVIAIVEGEPLNLIETLADRIATEVMQDERIQRTVVTVHKPEAPISVPFDDVSVTVERAR
jgi:7,8-dihydroneopterin aldolase/epimerase/oxygenase